MPRLLFTLSMPVSTAWDGKWSGANRNCTVTRDVTSADMTRLLSGADSASWTYRFSDGWVARVDARPVRRGERLERSDGFSGYDWMVDSIVRCGTIRGVRDERAVAL